MTEIKETQSRKVTADEINDAFDSFIEDRLKRLDKGETVYLGNHVHIVPEDDVDDEGKSITRYGIYEGVVCRDYAYTVKVAMMSAISLLVD